MNRTMNVEHVFRSETCATNLTWEWPGKFVFEKSMNQPAEPFPYRSPVCTRI